MTAEQIITEACLLAHRPLGQPGTPGMPLLRRFYDDIMDDVASRLGVFYQEWAVNITSGTATYCLPELDTVEAVYITNANGDKKQIAHIHSKDARLLDAYTDPTSGEPSSLIYEGIGFGRLWPVPNYSTTADPADGLIIQGYGPYAPDSYSLTTSNPLKRQDQRCIIYGVEWRILEDAGDPRQAGVYERYISTRNLIEINASRYSPAHGLQRSQPQIRATDSALNPLGF